MGNSLQNDGPRFKGRGFVPIIGRQNYQTWGIKLGINLIDYPEKAALPEIAARILVRGMRDGSFTGVSLSDCIFGESRDFLSARKIVNGRDKADLIAVSRALFQSYSLRIQFSFSLFRRSIE